MIKLITVIGARPQIIKAAALSRAISSKYSQKISEFILHTGQHYDESMSGNFFSEMNIPAPEWNLNIGSGFHGSQTAAMIEGIEKILLRENPDALVVYGDTNSTLAGALAASKLQIPVVHIEAGLRSFNRSMPEEINRVLSDHVSTLLFAPTEIAVKNLKTEGIGIKPVTLADPGHPVVYHCGDVMYDNVRHFSGALNSKSDILKKLDLKQGDYHLLTIHRDNNTDNPERLSSILSAILDLCRQGENFVFPLHPRTKDALTNPMVSTLFEEVRSTGRLIVTEPASYFDMIALEKNCRFIFTDSGGVQKEAYFAGKPCIILRHETEWKELVSGGNALIADAERDSILKAYQHFKANPLVNFIPLYGDGHAAEFICEKIIEHLG